jgi:hypothetical protein
MLLNTIRGATSWEDLLTINGHVCHSFKEACREKGLLEDDAEWSQVLEEATHWVTGAALHDMFASMLMFCEVTDPVLCGISITPHYLMTLCIALLLH